MTLSIKPLIALLVLASPWGCGRSSNQPFHPALVSPQALHARLAAKEPLLLADVRTPWDYQAEHIVGATNLRFDAIFRNVDPQLPKDRWIVIYCECPHEEASESVAQALHDKFGYDKLQLLKGGLRGWKKAGYKMVLAPTEKQ